MDGFLRLVRYNSVITTIDRHCYKINAPILLTKPGKEAAAQGFLSSRGIISGYVIGGATKIPESTAKYIFNVAIIK